MIFFLNTKLVCIFIKNKSDFFLKSFLCYKIADFEIQKKGLKFRLKLNYYVMHA